MASFYSVFEKIYNSFNALNEKKFDAIDTDCSLIPIKVQK